MSKTEIIEQEPLHEAPVPDEDYKPSEKDLHWDGEFKVRDIYHPNSCHSVERKIEAVSAYIVTGSSLKASKACNIPGSTIRTWRQHSCWWPEAEQAAKLKLDKEIEASLYKGLEQGIALLNRQMLEGKTVEIGTEEYATKDPDTGMVKKVKMKIFDKQEIPFKEMAIGWAVLWDKLQLAQGKPTSRTEKVESPKEILDQLKKELVDMSKAMHKEKQLNVVETKESQE